MDPYHWPKQRPQQPRPTQPQPPSQSPRPQPQQQSSLRTSSAPSFLSQPLMSSGFPTYAHSSHPPPHPPPPYQTIHHSQTVGDTMVPHPHSYQNVQNPLAVPMQHPLPQLPQLHHHSINSQTQSTQHPSHQPPLQIQHPRIPHSTHPPQLQPPQQSLPQQPQQPPQQQQPQSQNPQQQQQQPPQNQQQQQQQRQQQSHQPQHQQSQQQQQQQSQPQQQPHPPSSSQQLPPQQHPPPQSNQLHHQSHHRSHLHPPPHQHQQSRSIPIQPPPRQHSPPTLASPQSRAHHSPHPRDVSSAQHMSAQPPINPQVIGQQLSHLNQTPQQQQLSQHHMQQTPPQQSQQHQQQPSTQQQQYRQHPQHHRQQSCEPARVVYDSSSVYRLSQPQQQYFNPYSTAQQHVQPQQLNQHPPMYSSMPVPSHEYQQQPGSVTIPQESTVRSLPPQRMPPIHQHPPPNQHQRQPQPHIPQQQQAPPHMQSAQRPHQKLVAPLQPQPMQMVPMSRTQGQQHQDGQTLHHAHQQPGDPVNRQPLPSAPPSQTHQIPHSQQPRHITKTQPVPSNSVRPQVPERISSPAHMHPPPPQSQVHMTSAPIPSTLQSHQHQMQRQVMAGQPMQPRDRQHTMQPIVSQKPKASHHSVIQQQGAQQGKIPQAQHFVQQSGQSNEPRMMSRHAGQQFQDATSKHLPQSSGGALRSDVHVAAVGGSERQPVKQEQIPEQSGGVRQLKVEDALAYLEQVKSQFSNNPGVYNHFLDIMKEFKANTINTAEVIRRVSSLFQGHRKLILGFNTFLPPGYKIELRSDPTTGCVTGFSSPGGVFCALTESVPEAHPDERHQSAPLTEHGEIRGQPPHIATASIDPSAEHLPPHGRQGVSQTGDVPPQGQHPGMRPGFDHGGYHQPLNVTEKEKQLLLVPQSQEGTSISHDMKTQGMQQAPKDNAAAALAERFASPDQGVPVPGKRIEFEQAVTYVNKIKSRFADDQQAYQTFLGILQTYQKEQKSIKEVYKQVSHLFRDHEDLLGEFSNFLPEQSPQAQRQSGGPSQRITSDAVSGRSKAHTSQVKQQSVLEGTAVDSASPTYPGAKKEKPGKGLGRGRPSKPGSASLAPTGGISKPATSGRQKLSVQEKKGRKSAGAGKKSGHEGKGALTAGSGHVGQLASSEGATPELEFFDELRSLLGPDGQQNYSEFIKCLSLFSQEIICGDELMRLADGLLSHRKPLTDAFRAFLDQSDPRATQTAVEVLQRAKASAEGLDRPGSSLRGPPAPPVVSTPAVRERLRDLPPLVGIGGGGTVTNVPGSRSPKLNPLYKGKPLSQIGRDFGTELAGTSSYMTLPADVVQVQCSGMTADDRNVLNHMFVSKSDKAGHSLLHDDPARVGSVREESEKISSAPRGQKTSFGPPLHSSTGSKGSKSLRTKGTEPMGIDDQRLELEIMIARAETTSEKLEQLTKGETRNLSTFTAVDFKPIELVYKDASYDVIDVLRTNPNVTAPVVLKRLRQRLTDWHTSRKKIERLWKSSRFTGFSGLKGGPRTWRRSELKEEIMRYLTSNDIIDPKSNRSSPKNTIDCDLVCEDENLSVICDILWYAFEWEAEDVETADKGLEFVERLYGVIQKVHRKRIAMYVDEHLYVYMRLLAEVSQRVKYVLEHNYDGLTTQSLVQKVKDVLGGTVLLPAYDDHCRKLYGDSGEWASFLSDFPVVCKRLAEAALAVPQMQTSSELLHHAEGTVHSEEYSAIRDGDVVMKETETEISSKKTTSQVSAEGATQRLRSAMKIVGASRDEIFEVKVLQKGDETPEPSDVNSKEVNETKWILRMRHVPRETASQFERLTQEADQKQPISSAVTKYIRRAMKRKRQHDLVCSSESEKPVMYQRDGLDIRVNEGSGEKMYVGGTEDFFMKSTFVKRKAARLMLSESRKCKDVTVE